MIFVSGYQNAFGKQADDPAQAQSWTAQYQALLASAQSEEAARRMQMVN